MGPAYLRFDYPRPKDDGSSRLMAGEQCVSLVATTSADPKCMKPLGLHRFPQFTMSVSGELE